MNKTSVFLFAAAFSAFGAMTMAADAPSAEGVWVTQNKDGAVQIVPCDSGLCGYLVGLTPGQPPEDYPKDIHNADPARRDDSICGMALMGSLKAVEGKPGRWRDGWVYDPQTGDTYSAQMQLDGPDRLQLRGYLGISLLGRTETWTREDPKNKNRCVKPANLSSGSQRNDG
jgi:uncharacterized protein (DUF2147 family)